jgi:hypothetical protein
MVFRTFSRGHLARRSVGSLKTVSGVNFPVRKPPRSAERTMMPTPCLRIFSRRTR